MRITILIAIAFFLSGCALTMVEFRPAEPGEMEQPTAKASTGVQERIHIFPLTKGESVFEYEPGVLNLDPDWTPVRKFKPAFVTSDDVVMVVQDDMVKALQGAGYLVTVGPTIPSEVRYTIGGSLARLLVATHNSSVIPGLIGAAITGRFVGTGGTNPWAVIQAGLIFTDNRTGIWVPAPVAGADFSTMHLYLSQGIRRAVEMTRRGFREDLVVKFGQFQEAVDGKAKAKP